MRRLRALFASEAPDTPGERLHFRIFEGFVVAATASLSWTWAFYTQQLSGIARPLGAAYYLDLSWLYRPGVPLAAAALVTGLCLLGYLRRAPAAAYTLALVGFHLLYVARFSLGKAGHGSNFVGMGLLGLALGMTFFKTPLARRRFTLGFVWFFIGLAYVLAAGCKLGGTGLGWPDGHHLWMWMAERSIDVTSQSGAFQPGRLQTYVGMHYAAATAMLAAGLLTESLGWLFWWRRTRPFITLALVAMHLGITLVLNIDFTLYVVELLVVGLPWPVLLNRWRLGVGESKRRGIEENNPRLSDAPAPRLLITHIPSFVGHNRE